MDLAAEIEARSHALPQARLTPGRWLVGSPAELDLFERIENAGRPLREVIGGEPLYGIKTGLNEAFLLDQSTRDRLVAEDATSSEVIRKFIRGEDVDRWQAPWAGEWMIFARRGIDIERYPAVRRHLEQFRARLEPKPRGHAGKWEGRKAGSYKWYELQDPVDYWREFDKPKIVYQVIQFHSCYAIDHEGKLGNDKTFSLPTADLWVLAVLNSPLLWWFNWRHLVHMKDEALTPMGYLVEQVPIVDPSQAARDRAEAVVARLIDLTAGRTAGIRALLDWLRVELGVEAVSNKLSELVGLTADEVAAEVKKGRPGKKGLSSAELQRLKGEYATTVVPLRERAAEAVKLERELADLVNAAYGLTPADVALMWRTAPPRMPVPPPDGGGGTG